MHKSTTAVTVYLGIVALLVSLLLTLPRPQVALGDPVGFTSTPTATPPQAAPTDVPSSPTPTITPITPQPVPTDTPSPMPTNTPPPPPTSRPPSANPTAVVASPTPTETLPLLPFSGLSSSTAPGAGFVVVAVFLLIAGVWLLTGE